MMPWRTLLLVSLAMVAFAGNSLLARAALSMTVLDPASFTSLRLASGALVLCLIAYLRSPCRPGQGDGVSALALFVYAAGFSFAYVSLPAGTGALILFGAVQATMISWGWWRGERLDRAQVLGLLMALAGLVILMRPGLSAPPLGGSLLMMAAGIAWGVYSLRGRGLGDPTRVTAGNFLRATPLALGVSVLWAGAAAWDRWGVIYALVSGALASGIGYALWYAVLPALRPTQAASVQLTVPVLAALGGILVLGEPLTLRFVVASLAILSGVWLVIRRKAGV
ncbi:MAG: DMT family transporter [Gammaproteobacteria bacterium]|nr:MAG: DMT family transporter [Gammaproteobacteria bacterium]